MAHPCDPAYLAVPYLTLCAEPPRRLSTHRTSSARSGGPIFHHSRRDGSARVLVIGQDPAQHQTILRRILVGEAGSSVQGLLATFGFTRSYVFINCYLYSVYGSAKAKTRRNAKLIDYRNRCFEALLGGGQIEAVVALGQAADEALRFTVTSAVQPFSVAYAAVPHPTLPESSFKGIKTKLATAASKLPQNWNIALRTLAPSLQHPVVDVPLDLFGDQWTDLRTAKHVASDGLHHVASQIELR